MNTRVAFFGLNVTAVLLSLLTGLRIVPGPEIVGVLLSFYVLFILPGVLAERLFFGSGGASLEAVCRVFAFGVAYAALLSCTGLIPGWSYREVSVTGAAVTAVLLYVSCRRQSGGSGLPYHRPERRFVTGAGDGRTGRLTRLFLCAALFCAFFVLFSGSGELGVQSDSLDHISFVRRSLDSGTLFPNDSFHEDGDGVAFDPRKGLWHPVLSLWAFQSDVTPQFLWRMVPSCLAFFAVAAFLFFARELLGSTPLSFVAVGFLMFFYRAEGALWLTKIAFSRNVSQALLWISMASLLVYYRGRGTRYLLVSVLLAIVGAAFHAVYALLAVTFLGGMFIFVTFCVPGRTWRKRFWTSAAGILSALALPLSLRAAYTFGPCNAIHTHRQAMLLLPGGSAIVDPAEIVARFGSALFFALIVSPFISLIDGNKDRRALVATLFLFPTLVVLNPLTAAPLERHLGYLYYRILYAAPLMCTTALLVVGLLRIIVLGGSGGHGRARSGGFSDAGGIGAAGGRRSDRRARRLRAYGAGALRRIAAAAALALFFLYPVRWGIHSMRAEAGSLVSGSGRIGDRYCQLTEKLEGNVPAHSVIAADPVTSYVISAFTDHLVVVTLDQHCSPVDTMAVRRNEEIRNLLSPAVPLSESIDWLQGTGSAYIVVDTAAVRPAGFYWEALEGEPAATLEKLRACSILLREAFVAGGFHLFEIKRERFEEAERYGSCALFSNPLPCTRRQADGSTDAAAWLTANRGGRFGMEGEASVPDGVPPDASAHRSLATARSFGEDVGCGVILEHVILSDSVFAAGDTLRGSLCWSVPGGVDYGLPFELTIRLDTAYPTGAFYRDWYSKQYRRSVERRRRELYRLTVSGPLHSGFTPPDRWRSGEPVRQDFFVVLSSWLAEGAYDVRLIVSRRTYVPNRRVSDYLRNEDSYYGKMVARVHVGRAKVTGGQGAARRAGAYSLRYVQ